jgi:hypothetical protein
LRTVSESSTTITVGRLSTRRRRFRHHRDGRLNSGDRRPAGQCDRIEDQHDLAVAEHRRPGNADHPGQLGADILDDDF